MNPLTPQLNLPDFHPKLRVNNSKNEIFDIYRKKWVQLLPEEWVRQSFLNYLTVHLGYPQGLIRVEHSIKYNSLTRRPDAVVYHKEGRELLIIECKAPHVELTQDVLLQVVMYNKPIQVKFLIITNGIQHIVVKIEHGQMYYLETVPLYRDIC